MGWSPDELRDLYLTFAPAVFRRARQLLGRDADAWDAVHDVFVRLLEDPPQLTGTSAMGYVYVTTTNHCLRMLRTRLREGRRNADFSHALPGPPSTSAAPQEGRVDAREFVERLLAEGPGQQRSLEVAVYKHIDGMTQDQIAALLGVSRKTVQRDLDALRLLAQRVAQVEAQES